MKTYWELREGIAGAVAGGVAGGLAGGPVGAAAGAYLGHKVQQAGNAGKKKKDPYGQPTTVGADGKVKKEAIKPTKAMHVFNNAKAARAKAKEIGGRYVKGTGKSAGKHAAIKD